MTPGRLQGLASRRHSQEPASEQTRRGHDALPRLHQVEQLDVGSCLGRSDSRLCFTVFPENQPDPFG